MVALWSTMSHFVPIVLVMGVTTAQFYGTPGYLAGNSFGGRTANNEYTHPQLNSQSQSYQGHSGNSIPLSYNSAQAYNAPASSGYGVPSRSPASGDQSRYRIVPTSNHVLPDQHSNLIRYIVLKEFQLGQNGSASPLQIDQQLGLGRNAGSGGYAGATGGYPGSIGSNDMEVMRVEMPGSDEVRGSRERLNSGNRNNDAGANAEDDDDYDDEGSEDSDNSVDDEPLSVNADTNDNQGDYDDEDEDGIDSNSVDSGMRVQSSGTSSQRATPAVSSTNSRQGSDSMPMQVVPARGVALTGQRPSRPQAVETQAFMFSDPDSTSGELRRQSSALGTTTANIRNQGNRVRNQVQNSANSVRQRNQNRNRNRLNRNRNRNRNRNQNRNQNRNRNPGTSPAGGGSAGTASLPPINELTDALSLISRYFNIQAELMRTGGQDGGGVSNSLAAPGGGVSSYSNINGSSSAGPYPASGQSQSGGGGSFQGSSGSSGSSSLFSGSGLESATQATFPASTYGPPPGSGGFDLSQGNIFPNLIAGAVVRPIQQITGFKSSILNQVVNGLTAAGGAGSGGQGQRGELGGLGGLFSLSGGGGGAAAAPTLAPVYGPPSSSGQGSLIGAISGIKGSIVNTIANKGRAAVGIVGTKGRLASNQFKTTAHIATKGLSQTLANKHEAFQGVIKHIQSIFNSNPNLMNSGKW